MIPPDAGASEFHNFAAHRFVRSKAELLLAVVAKVSSGNIAHLNAVCTYYFAGRFFFDDQMIADIVEPVFVVAVDVSRLESFIEFKIKDKEAQAVGFVALLLGEPPNGRRKLQLPASDRSSPEV